MRSTEALSAEAEAALVERMRGGDMAARDALAASLEGVVCSRARKHATAGVLPFADLAQEGRAALVEALAMYDPARGRLLTHVWQRVDGAMVDAMRTETRRNEARWGEAATDAADHAVGLVLARAQAAMSAREWRASLLRASGMSWAEVGEEMGLAADAARKLVSRALRKAQQAVSGSDRPNR